jgi:hypothetical protein
VVNRIKAHAERGIDVLRYASAPDQKCIPKFSCASTEIAMILDALLCLDNAVLSQSSLKYRSPFRFSRRCAEQPLRHSSLLAESAPRLLPSFYGRMKGCSK